MGSLQEGFEVKTVVKNDDEVKTKENVGVFEEIPLDVKDYEELGLIVDLGELGDFEKTSIDFDAMFPDFCPEEENKKNYEKEFICSEPTADQFMKLEKWMELCQPEELKVGGESSMTSANNNLDYELMQWLWSPYSYEEYLRFYNGGI
ncbi:hypothetical protein K7X08_019680 [Anisodus acutangulus]|uniref:Uncharacterized protein n=1 Tax=Anisodus acutangulus TaxID=402998 RepID=A0A9Q1MS33_9SOLA|nr:hypothetical protein K7X08_019680 [Anisodus acutangulus]